MSIENFFSSTCKIRTRGASDEWGKPSGFTLGPAKKCRFDPKMSFTERDDKGNDIQVDGFVYILPDDIPKAEDEFEIDGQNFRIVKAIGVKVQRGFSDPHHVKIAVRKL